MLLTVPTPVQVVPPSVEYCQVPVPLVNPVTAIPLTAPLSTSVTFPEISVETRSPLFVVWSSLMVVKLLAPDRTGASLTAVTVRLAVAVAVLKGVAPPVLLAPQAVTAPRQFAQVLVAEAHAVPGLQVNRRRLAHTDTWGRAC